MFVIQIIDFFMVYLVVTLFVLTIASTTIYLVFVEKKRLEIASKLYSKALIAYKSKDYVQVFSNLNKSLIVPSNNLINREEALHNVKILHLIDLVLLNHNVDSERLTGELKRFLNDVHGVMNIDRKYFKALKSLLKNSHQVQMIDQNHIDSIVIDNGTSEISNEMLMNWRKGLAEYDMATH